MLNKTLAQNDTPQEKNWGAEEWRQPKPLDTDTVLYSEHGRILNKIDYRSHSFKLVKQQFGGYSLLVRHGGGDERLDLGYRDIELFFAPLDSDGRYLLLHKFLGIHHDAERAAQDRTAKMYRTAFAEGRLTKRKVRGSNEYKVTLT